VTNGDGILADQDVFNQQSHDFLPFNDTKRFRGAAQASKECCESFRQAQEYGTIIGLVSYRLQLSTECLLAMTQCRHTFTQLLKRQESFLIGGEKPFDTFANMGQLPLQTLLTFCGWIWKCALLPADDQAPAVSEQAPPTSGSPQPRRADRGVLVG
jgi:hypothetical protein